MVSLLIKLLGLRDVDVEFYEEGEDGLIVDVEVHADSAVCPRCGTSSQMLT